LVVVREDALFDLRLDQAHQRPELCSFASRLQSIHRVCSFRSHGPPSGMQSKCSISEPTLKRRLRIPTQGERGFRRMVNGDSDDVERGFRRMLNDLADDKLKS
jgi:hypothetical protein